MQVLLALSTELVAMAKNDLSIMLPDDSGVRACGLALSQLSHYAVQLVDAVDTADVSRCCFKRKNPVQFRRTCTCLFIME